MARRWMLPGPPSPTAEELKMTLAGEEEEVALPNRPRSLLQTHSEVRMSSEVYSEQVLTGRAQTPTQQTHQPADRLESFRP